MVFCHGFGCNFRTAFNLSSADRRRLTEIMASGRATPAAERRALSRAMVWLDRRMGPIAGTANHIARAAGQQHAGKRNQLDCFDTTQNTTSLLLLLNEWKLLRHHRIETPRSRGLFLGGGRPHVSAVVAESKSGARWVIDPWTRAYGQPPDIMPLEQWVKAN